MNTPPNREVAIFSAALELDASRRAAYLDEACADDPALRVQVEALLRVHEQALPFLADPAPGAQRPPESVGPEDSSQTLRIASAPSEKAGDRIGRYKLLQQIGEGGCGVVYMAEQTEPVRRRVALKVIKLGMDTKQVIARFEAERQALALMDHPNIAKVLEAGATETGRPYFVMELVKGIKITDYCDHDNLSTRERLGLFIQVCQAVQHAHQKGVIHRDIKPSNILVTSRDGVPVPKVIDFGIAKATTDQPLTNKTLFTAFEQFIGTPAYMSPEQAEMSELGIDTRTDIYSLGVLLYELLTGQTPFDAKDLLAAGLDAMRRTIREQEPVRPSTRLSTMLAADLTDVAKHRHTEGPKLSHLLRGDLDWIVMKCLEKDRARRYETANGVAGDIQRHLNCEPVVARPPSRLYEFQKTVRRHKFGFAAAAAVILVLATGVAVSTLEAIRATHAQREQSRLRQQAEQARARAEAGEKKAETEAARSEQVAQFMKGMLQGVGPSVALGRDTKLLREILDQTAKRLKDLGGQPAVEADLRETLGNVYSDVGEYTNATAMLEEALKMRRTLHGDEHRDVAQSLNDLGEVRYRQGLWAEAQTLHQESLAVRRKLLGSETLEVAQSLNNLGEALTRQGKLAQAEPLYREALATRRKLLGDEHLEVAQSLKHLEVAQSLDNLGLLLWRQNKYAEAEAAHRQALALRRKLLGDEHPEVATSLDRLGLLLQGHGDLVQAEKVQREALAMRQRLFGGPHPDLGRSLYNLGTVLEEQGKLAEAGTLFRESLDVRLKVLPCDHLELTQSLGSLSSVLRKQNKLAELESLYRETLKLLKQCLGDEHPKVAAVLEMLAAVSQSEAKTNQAQALFGEALAIRTKIAEAPGAGIETVGGLRDLGDAALRSGNLQAAESAFRLAVRKAEQAIATSPKEIGYRFDLNYTYGALFEVLWVENRIEESVSVIRTAIAAVDRALNDFPTQRHPFLQPQAHNYRYLGFRLERLKNYQAAREAFTTSTGIFRECRKAASLTEQATCWQGEASNDQVIGNLWAAEGREAEAQEAYRQSLAAHEVIEEQRLAPLITPGWASDHYIQLDQLVAKVCTPEDALRIARILRPPDSKIPADVLTALANCLFRLADVLRKSGKLDEAERLERLAAQKCRTDMTEYEKLASDPNRQRECLSFAISYEELGGFLRGIGQIQEAEKAYRDTQTLWRKLVAAFDTEDYRFHLAVNCDALANLLREAGRSMESLDSYREAQAIWLKLVAEFNHEDRRMHLGWTDENIGQLLQQAGRSDEATEVYRQALDVWRKLVSDFNKDDYLNHLSGTSARLAGLLRVQGKDAEAEGLDRELAERGDAQGLNELAWRLATSADAKFRGGSNAVSYAERAVAATSRKQPGILDTLAAAYAEAGQFDKAVGVQKEAMALLQNEEERNDYASRLRLYEAKIPYRDGGELASRAVDLLAAGKFSGAEPLARECLALREKRIPDDWRTFNTRSLLGGSLLGQKRYADAEPLLLLGYQGMKEREKRIPIEGRPRLKEGLERLVQLYEATNRPDQAADWKQKLQAFDTAEAQRKEAAPPKEPGADHSDTPYPLNSLGLTYEAQTNGSEAESVLREALALRRKRSGNDDLQTVYAMRDLADVLEGEGKWAEAETLHREALDSWRKREASGGSETAYTLHKLGVTLGAEGKWSQAEAVYREELALRRKQVGDDAPDTLYALRNLGITLEYEGNWAEAENVHREALASWRKRAGSDDPQTLYTLERLGWTLEGQSKWSEAENVYRETLASRRKRAGNEDSQTLSEFERLTRVLMRQKRLGETEQLLEEALTPTIVRQPSSCNLLVQRVELMGRQGRWQEAAATATLVVEYQPTDQFRYHTLAALLAITQNRPAYETFRRKILATFTNTANPYVDERIAKDCLFLPDPRVDLEFMDELADKAVSLGSGYPDAIPYFQAAKAMSAYRLGRFAESIEWAEKTLKSSIIYPNAHAYAILAMAHWELGHKDVARAMLVKGDSLTPNILPAHQAVDLGDSWVAWLIARISLDEATALIQPASKTASNSQKP